ncbi:MAG: hypothetical protein LV471_07880 [Nitrosomonas sp.]|nr:hypothetical protein [Nitrosomonas sp.]
MKTVNSIVISSIFALLISYLAMHASIFFHHNESGFSHETLARQYENLTREMQDKIHEQVNILELLNNKSLHFSFFEKNEQNIENYIYREIQRFEQTVVEYSDKAAYHHALATKQKDIFCYLAAVLIIIRLPLSYVT